MSFLAATPKMREILGAHPVTYNESKSFALSVREAWQLYERLAQSPKPTPRQVRIQARLLDALQAADVATRRAYRAAFRGQDFNPARRPRTCRMSVQAQRADEMCALMAQILSATGIASKDA